MVKVASRYMSSVSNKKVHVHDCPTQARLFVVPDPPAPFSGLFLSTRKLLSRSFDRICVACLQPQSNRKVRLHAAPVNALPCALPGGGSRCVLDLGLNSKLKDSTLFKLVVWRAPRKPQLEFFGVGQERVFWTKSAGMLSDEGCKRIVCS